VELKTKKLNPHERSSERDLNLIKIIKSQCLQRETKIRIFKNLQKRKIGKCACTIIDVQIK
jgi:hypothetical protein